MIVRYSKLGQNFTLSRTANTGLRTGLQNADNGSTKLYDKVGGWEQGDAWDEMALTYWSVTPDGIVFV